MAGIDEGPGCSSQLQAALNLTSCLRLLLDESSLVSTGSLSADTTPHVLPTALLSHSPHVRGRALSPLHPSLGSSVLHPPSCLSSPILDRIAKAPLLTFHINTTVYQSAHSTLSFPEALRGPSILPKVNSHSYSQEGWSQAARREDPFFWVSLKSWHLYSGGCGCAHP